MKKLLATLLILTAGLVFGQPKQEYYAEIIDQLLDASPTSIASDTIAIGGWDKVTFAVRYDETEAGGVSAALTVEIGYGDYGSIDWYDYDILLDKNGTDGPQASISFTADDEYVFYLPEAVTAQWVLVTVTATGSDADDLAQVNVGIMLQRY